MPLPGASSVYRMTTQLHIAPKTLNASGSGDSQTYHLHGSQPHHGNQPPHGNLNYQQLYYLPCRVPQGRRSATDGRCKQGKCRFLHLCKECYALHAWVACPSQYLQFTAEPFPPPTPMPGADRAANPWPTSLVLTQRLCTYV